MDTDIASARIVTEKELENDTARVMQEINEAGQPTYIIRHGRIISIIFPTLNINILGHSLAQAPFIPDAVNADNDTIHGPLRTYEEVFGESRGDQIGY